MCVGVQWATERSPVQGYRALRDRVQQGLSLGGGRKLGGGLLEATLHRRLVAAVSGRRGVQEGVSRGVHCPADGLGVCSLTF